MSTVRIGVSDVDEVKLRLSRAFKGEDVGEYISFASIEQLWRTMTPRRWSILRSMTGKGPMSLRSLARAVARDVKTTHGDVHVLLDAGVLTKTPDNKLEFPFDAIHVDFTITNAA